MMRALAKFILRVAGWTPVGDIPQLDKAVFIAAPHTSNWDGFWLIVYKIALGIKVRFLAKHSLFWWPLGPLLLALGAIPIDRSKHSSTVQQLVEAFATDDHLFLALAPEGTRRWKPYWKTGFYQIAKAADVPIVLAFIDYRTRRLGIGIQIDPGEDLEQNLQTIRDFYAPFEACRPERQGPIAFRPEHDQPGKAGG